MHCSYDDTKVWIQDIFYSLNLFISNGYLLLTDENSMFTMSQKCDLNLMAGWSNGFKLAASTQYSSTLPPGVDQNNWICTLLIGIRKILYCLFRISDDYLWFKSNGCVTSPASTTQHTDLLIHYTIKIVCLVH